MKEGKDIVDVSFPLLIYTYYRVREANLEIERSTHFYDVRDALPRNRAKLDF